jgi:hypothetical protein
MTDDRVTLKSGDSARLIVARSKIARVMTATGETST